MKKYVLLLIVFLLSITASAQYKPWTSAKPSESSSTAEKTDVFAEEDDDLPF